MLESVVSVKFPHLAKKKEKKFSLNRTIVVAVMGHVDHGKTSLLDAIRGTKVTETEAGGITQNTRAHQVVFKGHKITFIDTPGHEAFSEMRSRGARVTDIVLLVVAADDGVQPQTKESIKFALSAKVPVVVAINKIDLPGKNLNKLKQELTSAGLSLDEYGGDVMVNEVSAVKKTGLDELLDSVLLIAELQELKKQTPPEGLLGTAFVLESTLDDKLGPVSLMLTKSGNFKEGNFIVHEKGSAKIRALLDEQQQKLDHAEDGDPIWVIGLNQVLKTGEYVNVVSDEAKAKVLLKNVQTGVADLMEAEKAGLAEKEAAAEPADDLSILAGLLSQAEREKEVKYLNVIIKTNTQGTMEVVQKQLVDLNDEEVQIKVIDTGIGPVSERDISKAKASHGIVIGFQLPLTKRIEQLARKERVLVRNYEVIYELVDEMADALDSMAAPVTEKVEVARALVKEVFVLSNKQRVAGSEVIKGTLLKGYRVFVEREGAEIGEAKITELRQHKKEVKEVKKGQDCGILLEPNLEVEKGDQIVCFKIEKL